MLVALLPASAIAHEPLPPRTPSRRAVLHSRWDQVVPYADALAWQRQLRDERVQRVRDNSPPLPDVLLLMQHPPVLTLGTSSTEANLVTNPPPFELYRTERGGEVTYHGPGQLVLYPILDLRGYRQDVHWYMRSLEEVVLRTLASYGLPGERMEGLTGAWVRGSKVTMHGLALNVCPDLAHFEHIVPCGIADRPVSSMQALLGPDAPSMDAVQRTLLHHFSEVFGVELEPEVAPEIELAREIAPEIAREIGSLGLPADTTGLSAGATGPSPAPLVRPTDLAEPIPPAGFEWGCTS